MSARVLILDGNTPAGTRRIVSLGGRPYGTGYAAALRFFEPGLEFTIVEAATGETQTTDLSLTDFDGVAWTGSPLSAYDDTAEVTQQIAWARAVHDARVPCFGSCWGQQIMCQALGGEVRANPKGTEVGVAREIARTEGGAGHPMFAGKDDPFDALAIHRDEVVALPRGARVLAGNTMSTVQAMELTGDAGDFWGVQYHPEFDLHLMSILYARDMDDLVRQGIVEDRAVGAELIADFAALHEDPEDEPRAARHRIGADVRDPGLRMAELGNWLRVKVLPRAADRA